MIALFWSILKTFSGLGGFLSVVVYPFAVPRAPLQGMGAKDKDCFVCDDFKAWDPLSQSGPKAAPKAGGPLTKAELGQSSWAFIHTMAAYYNPKSENHKVSLALSILQRSYALGT